MVVLRQVFVVFTFASVFASSGVFAESTQLGSKLLRAAVVEPPQVQVLLRPVVLPQALL